MASLSFTFSDLWHSLEIVIQLLKKALENVHEENGLFYSDIGIKTIMDLNKIIHEPKYKENMKQVFEYNPYHFMNIYQILQEWIYSFTLTSDEAMKNMEPPLRLAESILEQYTQMEIQGLKANMWDWSVMSLSKIIQWLFRPLSKHYQIEYIDQKRPNVNVNLNANKLNEVWTREHLLSLVQSGNRLLQSEAIDKALELQHYPGISTSFQDFLTELVNKYDWGKMHQLTKEYQTDQIKNMKEMIKSIDYSDHKNSSAAQLTHIQKLWQKEKSQRWRWRPDQFAILNEQMKQFLSLLNNKNIIKSSFKKWQYPTLKDILLQRDLVYGKNKTTSANMNEHATSQIRFIEKSVHELPVGLLPRLYRWKWISRMLDWTNASESEIRWTTFILWLIKFVISVACWFIYDVGYFTSMVKWLTSLTSISGILTAISAGLGSVATFFIPLVLSLVMIWLFKLLYKHSNWLKWVTDQFYQTFLVGFTDAEYTSMIKLVTNLSALLNIVGFMVMIFTGVDISIMNQIIFTVQKVLNYMDYGFGSDASSNIFDMRIQSMSKDKMRQVIQMWSQVSSYSFENQNDKIETPEQEAQLIKILEATFMKHQKQNQQNERQESKAGGSTGSTGDEEFYVFTDIMAPPVDMNVLEKKIQELSNVQLENAFLKINDQLVSIDYNKSHLNKDGFLSNNIYNILVQYRNDPSFKSHLIDFLRQIDAKTQLLRKRFNDIRDKDEHDIPYELTNEQISLVKDYEILSMFLHVADQVEKPYKHDISPKLKKPKTPPEKPKTPPEKPKTPPEKPKTPPIQGPKIMAVSELKNAFQIIIKSSQNPLEKLKPGFRNKVLEFLSQSVFYSNEPDINQMKHQVQQIYDQLPTKHMVYMGLNKKTGKPRYIPLDVVIHDIESVKRYGLDSFLFDDNQEFIFYSQLEMNYTMRFLDRQEEMMQTIENMNQNHFDQTQALEFAVVTPYMLHHNTNLLEHSTEYIYDLMAGEIHNVQDMMNMLSLLPDDFPIYIEITIDNDDFFDSLKFITKMYLHDAKAQNAKHKQMMLDLYAQMPTLPYDGTWLNYYSLQICNRLDQTPIQFQQVLPMICEMFKGIPGVYQSCNGVIYGVNVLNIGYQWSDWILKSGSRTLILALKQVEYWLELFNTK